MKHLFTAFILILAFSAQAQTDTTKFKSATDYLHHREETDPNVTRIKKPALKIQLTAADTTAKGKSAGHCNKACCKKKSIKDSKKQPAAKDVLKDRNTKDPNIEKAIPAVSGVLPAPPKE